jgi:hypothetical protein
MLFVALFFIVASVGFYIGHRHEGEPLPLMPAASLQTFTSSSLGVSFEYSPAFGSLIEQVHERGDCPQEKLIATDACEHRYIGYEKLGTMRWLVSAESRLFALHPLAREGLYEDTLRSQDIDSYCSQGYPLSCTQSTNTHGLRVVKVGYSPACNGLEVCSDQVFFLNFIETKNVNYPILVLWYDRSEERSIPDSVIDEMVQSMRPIL